MDVRISKAALGAVSLVVVTLAIVFVAGCAPGQTTPTTSAPATAPTTSAPATAPTTSAPATAPTTSAPATAPTTSAPTTIAAPIVWKLDTNTSLGTFDGDIIQEFARTVSERTNGRLKIEVYPRSALGLDASRTLRNLKEGVIQIAAVPAYAVGGEEPSFIVTETPGVWKGPSDVIKAATLLAPFKKKVYRDVWGSEFLDFATFGDTGFGFFWYQGAKWDRLSSMQGQKVRATNAVQANQLKLLGASPEVASNVDWYMMQKTKVVTGGYTGVSAAIDMKIYEVATRGVEFDYAYAVTTDLVVTAKEWDALPPDIQMSVRDAAKVRREKALARRQSYVTEIHPKLLDQMKDKGVEIHRWPAEDYGKVGAAGSKVLVDWVSEVGARPSTGARVKEAFELISPVLKETGVLK